MKCQNPLLFVLILLGWKKDITATAVNTTATHRTVNDAVTKDSYRLVWSDEFNYTGLPDSNYWDYERGYSRNNEAQFYIKYNLGNSKVENGVLTITALYNKGDKHPITSASIITLHKVDFCYGRVEVSAKMPVGKGAWPAIWLMGVNRDTVDWPACGEIDVMEWLGRAPQFITGSLYTSTASGKETSQVTPHFVLNYKSLSIRFHTYSIEWDSTAISFYYDDTKYVTYRASQMSKAEWAPFRKPAYLLLNLALGGTSGGAIDYSRFPFIYQIDYVRYYQKQ